MAPLRGRAVRGGVALGLAALLGGCGALNPASWFHHREGGVIAAQHGPLPGANQPYPNLATVPARPAPPDLASLDRVTEGLMADRAHAQHLAAAVPLPDPSRPSTAPALFGVGSLPPPVAPEAGALSATIPAATAAPAAPTAPPPTAAHTTAHATAPAAAALSAPLAPISGGPALPPKPPRPPTRAPVGAVASTPLPAIPTAPPAPPVLAGAGASPAAASPAAASPASASPAAASVPPLPPASAGIPADRVSIAFAPGASGLPPGAGSLLRALAARRGSRTIEALGHGAAVSADPAAQAMALKLGLARARAIAAGLRAAGVPATAIRLAADASGHGGAAILR